VNKSAAVYSGQGGCTDFPFDVAPLKSSNTPITFPKLHVVLATHLLGSTSRRLLVNAVKLCCADHLPAAVHHKHFVPHDGSAIQKWDRHVNRMSQGSAKLSAGAWNLCTCGIRLYRRELIDRGRRVT
jgi:hypothetical protein